VGQVVVFVDIVVSLQTEGGLLMALRQERFCLRMPVLLMSTPGHILI
jgi:hypothetical protein